MGALKRFGQFFTAIDNRFSPAMILFVRLCRSEKEVPVVLTTGFKTICCTLTHFLLMLCLSFSCIHLLKPE
jgi:hypothetical protein